MIRTLIFFLLAFSGTAYGFECYRDGSRKCKSCAESVECVDGLYESSELCAVAALETCFEVTDDTYCIAAETACFCGERTGCMDDPYSKSHYIDCSASGVEIYKACDIGLVHNGNCGCVQPHLREDNDDKLILNIPPLRSQSREACDADCPYNTSAENCSDNTYFPCASPGSPFYCGPEAPCFSVEECACVENTTSCTSTCNLQEVPSPDGCSQFEVCDVENSYTPCLDGLCFVQENCTCLPPPTTTSTTTPYPCPECGWITIPEEDGCNSYAPCSAPEFITVCPDGCYDEETCMCTTTGSTSGTTSNGGSSGTTTDAGGSGTTTDAGGSGTTTDGGGSGTTTDSGGSETTTDSGGSGTTTDSGGSGSTTSECLDCGFAAYGECGYIRCDTGDISDCPNDTCFVPSTCLCEDV